jgi:hypothetical protein
MILVAKEAWAELISRHKNAIIYILNNNTSSELKACSHAIFI